MKYMKKNGEIKNKTLTRLAYSCLMDLIIQDELHYLVSENFPSENFPFLYSVSVSDRI